MAVIYGTQEITSGKPLEMKFYLGTSGIGQFGSYSIIAVFEVQIIVT